jgi:hypothetical protein
MRKQIPELLQQGPNPKQNGPRAGYNRLIVRQVSINRWELVVQEMRGDDVYYKHHNQVVGEQTFVQTIRDIATKYRIHKENYVYITTEDR